MILFLKPYFEIKPWAGDELNKIFDCPEKTGEAWIVSGYKNKSSIVLNGKYKDETLRHLWRKHPELFGDYPDKEFPLLLKLISAKDNLSVQVHPNDDYAIKTANSLGKFECWYILPETKATSVTLGVNVKNSIELRNVIKERMLENFLINKEIEADDLVIVEPGRVHAIHGNTFLLETQESSDITYRLYDFNRLPKRELHIEDSLNVIDYNNDKNLIHRFKDEDTFKNSHFNLYKLYANGKTEYENKGFEIFYVVSGNGTIDNYSLKKGDTFILTAEHSKIQFDGNLEIIAVIPKPKEKDRLKMRKVALITGIIGQDGYYLTKLLLEKNYEVHGMVQSMNQFNSSYMTSFKDNENFFIHIGDMTDTSNINRLLENIKPDEIYHLASQSHVDLSFEIPEYTAQVNALGTLRLLDSIKNSEIRTKLFNLSTPYLFSGKIYPQKENTPFEPTTPYAISKQYAHSMVKSYRDNYSLYAVNGICYNHTSPYRMSSFVSKKIIEAAKKVKSGEDYILELGNLTPIREWGSAKDYAYAMWISLQQPKPTDYIISTGIGYSVREIVEIIYSKVGIKIIWTGNGIDEIGIDQDGKTRIKISSEFIRPYDPEVLVGDSTKFNEITGYKIESNINELIDSMLEE